MVSGQEDASALMQALRFSTYSAIILSISGTFLSLLCILYCTSIHMQARQLLLHKPDSWPSRISRGETLEQSLFSDEYQLLHSFGLPKKYRIVNLMLTVFLLLAYAFAVVAVTLWVWLTESKTAAGVTMVVIAPVFFSTVLISLKKSKEV